MAIMVINTMPRVLRRADGRITPLRRRTRSCGVIRTGDVNELTTLRAHGGPPSYEA